MNFKRLANMRLDIIILLIIFLFIYPLLVGFNPYYIRVFFYSYLLAIISLAWAVLAVANQISFGHAAFFGLAAYISGILSLHYDYPIIISILIATLGGTFIVGGVVAVTFRLKEVYFALSMLAYAEILKYIVINTPWITGGSEGLLNIPSLGKWVIYGFVINFMNYTVLYYLFLLIMLISVLIINLLMHSRVGYALKAISKDEIAAESCGINVFKYKMIALIISAILTSLAGSIYAHFYRYLYPDTAFSDIWTLFPIIASLFGGYQYTIIGPIFGAIFLNSIKEFIISKMIERGYELIYGGLLAFILLVLRKGVFDWIYERIWGRGQ